MVRHVRDSILSALLLVFATLLTGCAGVREQTIGPEYPGEFSQLYNSPCEWSYNPYYAYGRPDYCDPFLGEPFRSHYYFIHDPYWYYYNAYFNPYQPYYPFYPYAPYYGYYYHDDVDHCHRSKHSFGRIRKHRDDDGDSPADRIHEWQARRKDRWEEIQNSIRDARDARMEQWQGIREQAQNRREEHNRQWQDFSGRVQDRIGQMQEERRERWNGFFNNAENVFSGFREQRQERIEQRRDFFKEHGLLRNDNHQPLFKHSDNTTGNGNGLFNGGILRGWGGRR